MTCPLPFNARHGVITLEKEAADALTVAVDWTDVITTPVTISSSAWAVFPTGAVTLSGTATTGYSTSALVSAGGGGQVYEITNTVTTSAGQTYAQKIQVYVKQTPTIFVYV